MSFRRATSGASGRISVRSKGSNSLDRGLSGTRSASAAALPPHQYLLSTGIPSLDDVLGGGVLSGCLVAFCIEDDGVHAVASSTARIILKHWVVQACTSNQTIHCGRAAVVGGQGLDGTSKSQEMCKSLPNTAKETSSKSVSNESVLLDKAKQQDSMSIAWRYQGLQPFKTSVPEHVPPGLREKLEQMSLNAAHQSHGEKPKDEIPYCQVPDLATVRSSEEVQALQARGNLRIITALPNITDDSNPYEQMLLELESFVDMDQKGACRLAFDDVAGMSWPSGSASSLFRAILRIRALLRRTGPPERSPAAAIFVLPTHLHKGTSREHDTHRILHLFDIIINLYPLPPPPPEATREKHCQCALTMPKISTPCAIQATSAKQSVLLGLNSGQGWSNDLGIRITRRRITIETLNLGSEGGVGERQVPLETVVQKTPRAKGYDPAKKHEYDF